MAEHDAAISVVTMRRRCPAHCVGAAVQWSARRFFERPRGRVEGVQRQLIGRVREVCLPAKSGRGERARQNMLTHAVQNTFQNVFE